MKNKLHRHEEETYITRYEERFCEDLTLRYYLSVSTSSRVASYGIPLYSVKIELEQNGKISESEAKDLFADGGKALCFFNSLVKNLVTPSTLKYIIEDRISV